MITIKEIAQICNVSAATVSNILNGKSKASAETTQKVLAVVEETGYKPNYVAQGLRRQKTHMIAIIAEDIAQFTSPPMIESIMQYCESMGYHVIVQNLRLYARWHDTWYNKEEAYHSILDPTLQDLLSMRVDGVIYIAGHARIIHCFPDDFPIPAVMAYAFSDSTKVPSIVIDDVKSAYEVVSHLLEHDHRKVGILLGREDNIHSQQRLLGYQKALFEKEVPFDPDLIYYGRWNRTSGFEGAKMLIEKGATAIFSISDEMAGGVYDYLEEAGLQVGKDISVGSFDDREIAQYFRPGLTTTALPLAEIGAEAARTLVAEIEKSKEERIPSAEPVVVRIPCEMRIRRSVGRNQA